MEQLAVSPTENGALSNKTLKKLMLREKNTTAERLTNRNEKFSVNNAISIVEKRLPL